MYCTCHCIQNFLNGCRYIYVRIHTYVNMYTRIIYVYIKLLGEFSRVNVLYELVPLHVHVHWNHLMSVAFVCMLQVFGRILPAWR